MKNKNIFSLISSAMLLLAILPSHSYGYFEVLRWVVASTGLVNAYHAYKLKEEGWVFVMIMIAILFNPIYPFQLLKGTWATIDLVVTILVLIFLISDEELEVNHLKHMKPDIPEYKVFLEKFRHHFRSSLMFLVSA